jgi:nucleoside phosphorylase
MVTKVMVATEYESQWLTIPTTTVGVKAAEVSNDAITDCDQIILFGSCGVIKDGYWQSEVDWYTEDYGNYWNATDLSSFIEPSVWYYYDHDKFIYAPESVMATPILNNISNCWHGVTSTYGVHERYKVDVIRSLCPKTAVVDMESWYVGKLCNEVVIPFTSIRYIIDRCHRRCKPPIINHFWRKYQHKRMQIRFNNLLREYAVENNIRYI